MKIKKFGIIALTLTAIAALAQNKTNVIDEVAWIVGDEAIFRSDIEEQYATLRNEGTINGNPYCVIPEQIAVEKLYLHQAKLDTIEPLASQISAAVERRINFFISNLGSREKMEEYFNKPISAIREQLADVMRTQYIIEQVKNNLTKNVKSTPSDVRKYYNSLPADSIPFIPMQVEAQIITVNPIIPRQEIEDVKARLREYADRVNNGEVEFSTLAIMYSEDGSAMQGGELGYHSKADWVPEFSNVAFNLNDPKKCSRVVETEYGFHIIQLIDKKGDQVNVRHILNTPKVSTHDLSVAVLKLDSLRKEIVAGKAPFGEAAKFVSQDKDTRNNNGVMINPTNGSTRFEMQDLPQEAARRIETMNEGDISEAFIMKDVKKNKDVVAIVKLTKRIPGHKASLADDFNMIKEMYENNRKDEIVRNWVEQKIKDTYVVIEDGWQNCDFKYSGWIKK